MNEDDATLSTQLDMMYKAFVFYNGTFADIFEVRLFSRPHRRTRLAHMTTMITSSFHSSSSPCSNTRASPARSCSRSSRRWGRSSFLFCTPRRKTSCAPSIRCRTPSFPACGPPWPFPPLLCAVSPQAFLFSSHPLRSLFCAEECPILPERVSAAQRDQGQSVQHRRSAVLGQEVAISHIPHTAAPHHVTSHYIVLVAASCALIWTSPRPDGFLTSFVLWYYCHRPPSMLALAPADHHSLANTRSNAESQLEASRQLEASAARRRRRTFVAPPLPDQGRVGLVRRPHPEARPSHRYMGANWDGSLSRSLRLNPKDEGEERPAVSLLVPESPRSSNNFQHRVSRLSEVNGSLAADCRFFFAFGEV